MLYPLSYEGGAWSERLLAPSRESAMTSDHASETLAHAGMGRGVGRAVRVFVAAGGVGAARVASTRRASVPSRLSVAAVPSV